MKRWWVYQRERFPLLAHGPLIFAFSTSALTFSALLHGDRIDAPGERWGLAWATAFLTCLVFFLQLRIADEFKDAEEDRRWRPYRPVPRGLVRLRELGWVFAGGAVLQAGFAWILQPTLFFVLVPAWSYLALMSHEFFAREWLKARPITYLWTHMLIMPIVDLYATSCHWLARGLPPHPGLKWFLAVSFANGVLIELGRKLRRPEDEEDGVDTYTRLWGGRTAPVIWLGVLGATVLLAVLAAGEIGTAGPTAGVGAAAFAVAAWQVQRFRREFPDRSGKGFETFTGLWTLVLYLGLGPIPYLVRT
jgi:4-hydroxybenzoate polyprenyltransferase